MENEKPTANQMAAVGFAIGVMLCLIIGMFVPKEKEIKEVVKYKERVRVVKRIVERPDGTKETTEITDSEKNFLKDKELKVSYKKDWNIGVGRSIYSRNNPDSYTVMIQRRILGDLHIGVYGRTDLEVGALISYSF
jgi:hypothetical protein